MGWPVRGGSGRGPREWPVGCGAGRRPGHWPARGGSGPDSLALAVAVGLAAVVQLNTVAKSAGIRVASGRRTVAASGPHLRAARHRGNRRRRLDGGPARPGPGPASAFPHPAPGVLHFGTSESAAPAGAPALQYPREWHEFYFTRAAYSSYGRGGWGRRGQSWAIDYPKADIQFLTVLKRLTRPGRLRRRERGRPQRPADPQLPLPLRPRSRLHEHVGAGGRRDCATTSWPADSSSSTTSGGRRSGPSSNSR